MEIWILNNLFQSLYLIDDYESLIWTESYIGCGNFELYAPINDYYVTIIGFVRAQRASGLDTYVWLNGSDQVMIIERIEMSTNVENGSRFIFSGRSLECILERRIVWNQTTITGKLQNGVQKILNENIINPAIADRKIPGFIFEASTDSRVLDLKLEQQITGDNIYEWLYETCEAIDLGFRVKLNENNQFVFSLCMGLDRSYEQLERPYVIFSPKFENLISSNLLEDITEYKNITLVAGEDKDLGVGNRRSTTVGSGVGLSRRELYTDARDLQSENYDDNGDLIITPDDQYIAQLAQRGSGKLSEYKAIKEFEGEVDATNLFVYGKDFYKGDIVQVQTEYGVMSRMRVMRMMRSQDKSGHNAYPTFKILNDTK